MRAKVKSREIKWNRMVYALNGICWSRMSVWRQHHTETRSYSNYEWRSFLWSHCIHESDDSLYTYTNAHSSTFIVSPDWRFGCTCFLFHAVDEFCQHLILASASIYLPLSHFQCAFYYTWYRMKNYLVWRDFLCTCIANGTIIIRIKRDVNIEWKKGERRSAECSI